MYKITEEGLLFFVKVSAKSGCNAVVGREGDRLKVKVTAVPEKGRANRAVVKVIAEWLGVAPSRVEIVSGEAAPLKSILVLGLTEYPF